jgi:hypothetical protein
LHCIISFDYCTLINDTINQDLRMFPFDVCYELTIFECMMIIIGIFLIIGIVVLVKIARDLRDTINTENDHSTTATNRITDVLRELGDILVVQNTIDAESLVAAEQNRVKNTTTINENTAVLRALVEKLDLACQNRVEDNAKLAEQTGVQVEVINASLESISLVAENNVEKTNTQDQNNAIIGANNTIVDIITASLAKTTELLELAKRPISILRNPSSPLARKKQTRRRKQTPDRRARRSYRSVSPNRTPLLGDDNSNVNAGHTPVR